jgi:hypothetical protein
MELNTLRSSVAASPLNSVVSTRVVDLKIFSLTTAAYEFIVLHSEREYKKLWKLLGAERKVM